MIFLAKRWHRWQHALAKWALVRVDRLRARLVRRLQSSGKQANELHDKARLRMEVCRRCPELTSMDRCRVCGCNMLLKTQVASAACPRGRW